MPLELSDVRVVDLSQGVAGPYCTMFLADLGCRVTKVEPPWGDWARDMGVPVGAGGSAVFSALNRGKEGCVFDLKTSEGKRALLEMARRGDVLVENFRPGVMDRLGLGWDALAPLNPRLIYCSVSAFGATGPYKDKKGTDSILQGFAGLMSITGEEGRRPLKVGLAVSDMFAGVLAAQAILAAMIMRERDGRGRRIELSLVEALLELQRVQITEYLITGVAPSLRGNVHAHLSPSQSFETSDGEIMVAVVGEGDWARFCAAVGLDELVQTSLADTRERVRRQPEIAAILEPVFRSRTSQEWLERLERYDVLCGPIHDYHGLLRDPHIASLGGVETQTAPPTLRSPARFIRGGVRSPDGAHPPDLGEHTEAVLRALGLPGRQAEEETRTA